MTPYTLRPATPADYDFLFTLHRKAMKPYIDATWGWHDKWQEEYFAKKFDPDKRQIIVIDGKDAGVLVVGEKEGALYLELIEILPAFQGRGVGSAIIRRLKQQAAAEKRPLTLNVLRANRPAIRLYKRLGFLITGSDKVRLHMTYTPLNDT